MKKISSNCILRNHYLIPVCVDCKKEIYESRNPSITKRCKECKKEHDRFTRLVYEKVRYATDEKYRAERKAWNKIYQKMKYATDEKYREKRKKYLKVSYNKNIRKRRCDEMRKLFVEMNRENKAGVSEVFGAILLIGISAMIVSCGLMIVTAQEQRAREFLTTLPHFSLGNETGNGTNYTIYEYNEYNTYNEYNDYNDYTNDNTTEDDNNGSMFFDMDNPLWFNWTLDSSNSSILFQLHTPDNDWEFVYNESLFNMNEGKQIPPLGSGN